MNIYKNKYCVLITLSFLCLGIISWSNYPQKPIKIIIPFGSGSLTDKLFRKMERPLGSFINQTFEPHYVKHPYEAWKRIEMSKSDGYTLGIFYDPLIRLPHETYPEKYPKIEYDVIAIFAQLEYILVVSRDSTFETLSDFISYAKKNPGRLNFGFVGDLNLDFAQQLIEETNIETKLIPYKNNSNLNNAVLSRHIDAAILTTTRAGKLVLNGKLRGLAVFSEEKLPYFNVSTAGEQGIKVFFCTQIGFSSSKGINPDNVIILQNAIKKSIETEDFKNFINRKFMTMIFLKKGCPPGQRGYDKGKCKDRKRKKK